MKEIIKDFGDSIKNTSFKKSTHYTKTLDYSFCFFYALDEINNILVKLNNNSFDEIRNYLLHVRSTALVRSVHYHGSVDYSFCFFYVLDEIKEYLATFKLTEEQINVLKTWNK